MNETLETLMRIFQKRADEATARAASLKPRSSRAVFHEARGEAAGIHFCIGAVAAAMKDAGEKPTSCELCRSEMDGNANCPCCGLEGGIIEDDETAHPATAISSNHPQTAKE